MITSNSKTFLGLQQYLNERINSYSGSLLTKMVM